ncbi:hypothetical protein [Burkholderia pseudomallei]|uniref:hypothetical protein n=1 Tax=Burkholderia pseudomallei TaxID=28450 RepID=UPI0001722887|nr:hypothetical protein [Burkholderia pseudomallei]EDS82402.1 gp43 [Burkholderia pseudomallei S13]BEH27421.1 hypothetical protein GTC050_46730 [Burkholderia pseudomallei]
MNDQQQSRADALTEEQIRAFAENAFDHEVGAGALRQNVATVGNVILAIRNALNLAASANETGAEGAAITDHDAKGLEIIAGWLYKDGLVEPAAMLRRLASARSPAMAAAAPADEHSTIECQAHSGPDCTECGGTGAWSGSADERAALQWAAGTLQEIVSGRWKGAKESDKVSIGSVTKTVAQVLDMADAALGRASQGNAPAEMRKPDAYVPIHPRNGPLWASAVTSLDADRPKSYPVQAVYLGASTAALSAARAAASPAADEAQALLTVGRCMGIEAVEKYIDSASLGTVIDYAAEIRKLAAPQPAPADAPADVTLIPYDGLTEEFTDEVARLANDAPGIREAVAGALQSCGAIIAPADAPAHAAECPHCDGEGVIEADSGASPCACAQDAQEGMPTFGARRTQADAPAEARV